MNTATNNVKIKSIAVCIPEHYVDVYDNKELYKNNRNKLRKVVESSGFHIRHILPTGSKLTASDLCEKAANKVLEGINKDEISALIFVSNTVDYIVPATSSLMQKRLNLSEDILTFDMNSGCSGVVSGLLVASKLVNKENRKVLLLVGNTLSKMYGIGEDALIDPPFHGDGGGAVLLEYSEHTNPIYYNSGTRSEDFKTLYHLNGGFRNQPTKDMFKADGSFNYGSFMDGLGVFNFSITQVPFSINSLLSYANTNKNTVDYFILHQANISIIKNIARMLDLPFEKVPYDTLPKYGNLSAVSLLSVITDKCEIFNNSNFKIVFASFGVGLAWSSALLHFENINVFPTIFMED